MSKPDERSKSQTVADDGIPAGDSPPKPRWPLVLAAVAWGMWVVFLVVMLMLRLHETPRG